MKFGNKSKKNSKKTATEQNEDIPERPKSMAQEQFNLEEADSIGTLDKAQRKEILAANRKAQ